MACIRYLALDNLKRTESLAQQSDDGSEWDDLRRDDSVLLARVRDCGAYEDRTSSASASEDVREVDACPS